MPRALLRGSWAKQVFSAVYLAYRIATGPLTSPRIVLGATVGPVWLEEAVCLDGAKWNAPILLTHSDAILDNRAVLAVPKGT